MLFYVLHKLTIYFLGLWVKCNLVYMYVNNIVAFGRRYGESGIVTIHTWEHGDETSCVSIGQVIIGDNPLHYHLKEYENVGQAISLFLPCPIQ